MAHTARAHMCPHVCVCSCTVQALAKHSGCYFLNITASSIMSKWLGDANRLVRAIFTVSDTHTHTHTHTHTRVPCLYALLGRLKHTHTHGASGVQAETGVHSSLCMLELAHSKECAEESLAVLLKHSHHAVQMKAHGFLTTHTTRSVFLCMQLAEKLQPCIIFIGTCVDMWTQPET